MICLLRRSVVLALALACLPAALVLAAPTLHLDPPSPILGKPLTIIISLDDDETVLSGLPDLGVFEPLAPPLRNGNEIRLVVLPMRAGVRELPPFPLQVGTARQIETAAMRVTILEGIAQNAAIAPLKRRPFPLVGSGPGGWIIAGSILLLLIGAAGTFFWRWWHRPDFFKLPPAVQLAQLNTRARKLQPTAERSLLLDEIRERRFAPVATHADDIYRLHRKLLSLLAGEE